MLNKNNKDKETLKKHAETGNNELRGWSETPEYSDNTSETDSYKCIDAVWESGPELPGIK